MYLSSKSTALCAIRKKAGRASSCEGKPGISKRARTAVEMGLLRLRGKLCLWVDGRVGNNCLCKKSRVVDTLASGEPVSVVFGDEGNRPRTCIKAPDVSFIVLTVSDVGWSKEQSM